MDDERVVPLLENIRDLQRQQVEAYARALKNQEEALTMQRRSVTRIRGVLAIVGGLLVVLLVVVVLLLRYVLTHYS